MRRQLFYLTSDALHAYGWDGRQLERIAVFASDEAGTANFAAYLAAAQKVPAVLLVDVIEEDYQREVMPHVFGRARRNMIDRRLAQVYRDTPYRHAMAQGRESGGRRDDRMLFSALTNPDALKPWFDAINAQAVPVAGFYSLALLSPLLFAKLQVAAGNVLFVLHDTGGLRQNYFHEGVLRFSRLVPLPDHRPHTVATALTQETAKTRQFLASTRVLARDAMLTVATVAPAASLDALRAASPDTPASLHEFIGIEDMAARLGLPQPATAEHGEHLFLQLLCKRLPATHYVVSELTRLFQLWQTRIALTAMSALVAAGGALWTANNLYDAWAAHEGRALLAMETSAAEARYADITASLPPTEAHPHDMKSAVDVEQMIVRNAADPVTLLQALGSALQAVPAAYINRIRWTTAESAPQFDTTPADGAAPPPVDAPVPGMPLAATALAIPVAIHEVMHVEGEILSAGQDYRGALDAVQALAARLSEDKRLKVHVERRPLDTRPNARLEGAAGDDGGMEMSTGFAMTITRSP